MKTKMHLFLGWILFAVSSASAANLPAETNLLLAAGSVWKYNNTGTDLQTAWRQFSYDDSAWSFGPAQLGGGDGDEKTVIDLGPEGARYPTVYFRTTFTVPDASRYTNMLLRLLRDDGGVVYLNGLEVFRSNMPTNQDILYTTWASTSVPAADETTNFYLKAFVPTNLRSGQNVLAVEIHQIDAVSTDLSFDLELKGVTVPTQGPAYIIRQPTNITVIAGTNVSLSVLAAGALPISYQWSFNGTNIPGANTDTLAFNAVQLSDLGVYSVTVTNALGGTNSLNATLVVKPQPTYDMARDFSTGANPSAAWAYGYQTDFGAAFVPFGVLNQQSLVGGAMIDVWSRDGLQPSRVSHNGSSATGTSDGGQGSYPPGTLWLEPGVAGQPDNYAVVRFTVPAGSAGRYEFICSAQSQLNGSLSSDSDFHIYKDGLELFTRYLAPNASTSYSNILFLAEGETLDFMVGRGGDNLAAGSGLKLVAYFTLISPGAAPATILVQPQSRVAAVGGSSVFSVLAVSAAPLSYQWQLNDAAIPGANSATLALSNLQPADAGNYSVLITSDFGAVNSAVAVLALKPKAQYDLVRDFAFPANSSGSWSYGWESALGSSLNLFAVNGTFLSENGVLLDSWSRVTNQSASVFYNPTPSTATTDNRQGVFPPGTLWFVPGVENNPDNYAVIRLTIPAGGTGMYQLWSLFHSHLNGTNSSDCDFHLLRNGLEVYGQNLPPNFGLTYSNLLWLEAGDTLDFAVGRGADGKTAGSGLVIEATLASVTPQPIDLTILGYPQDQTNAINNSATFSVVANGTGPLTYQWSYNGTDFPQATNSQLLLSMLTTNMAGTYKVLVSDSLGSTVTAKANLTVLDFANGFIDSFEPSYNPLLWSSFGGTVLANNYGGSLSSSNSLWFGGDGTRFAMTRPVNGTRGASLSFGLCLGNGSSTNFDQPELPGDGVVLEYSFNKGTNWTQMGRYDTTNYMKWSVQEVGLPGLSFFTNVLFRWRQLTNGGAGQDNWVLDNVQLAIGPSLPIVVGQPQDTIVVAGRAASMSVVVMGTKPYYYQWQKDGVNLPSQTSATLSIAAASTNDGGLYTVIVSNSVGVAASLAARLQVYDWGDSFQITSLGTNASIVEVNPYTGDDRGGIALSGMSVFNSGDNNTARFALADLSQPASLGRVYDSMVCDFQNGAAYSLGTGTNVLPYGGGTITSLLELDPLTGALTGRAITLSSPIPFSGYSGGIFSGYGRILLHTGSRVYMILLPSGVVFDLGAMSAPSHQYTESWAYWGASEYFGGTNYLVYVRDSRTIVRTRVPDGAVTTVATFSSLSDMASITMCPLLDRWYFHFEGSSQFGSGTELLGYANATFSYPSVAQAPSVTYQPTNLAMLEKSTNSLAVSFKGTRPLSYQWFFNGQLLANQTNTYLPLNGVSTNASGVYTVLCTNMYGSALSAGISLTVISMGPDFQVLSLGTNNSFVIDHDSITGDDRGGVVASAAEVFVTGDNSTARFSIGDMSGGTALGRVYDGMVSDLRAEKVYLLANGTNLITSSSGTITTLRELDSLTGDFTGNSITLSAPITLNYYTPGIFSGYGRIVIMASHAWQILMPYGIVIDMGAISQPSHSYSESWAYWGVAEYFGGSLYVDYVQNSQTINRMRIPDGAITTLASFYNLSDMASFTVAPYWDRWYFHHEYNSQFGNGNEMAGFADASFSFTPDPVPPTISASPRNQPALLGGTASFRVVASGARPFSYQWSFNGNVLTNQTNAILTLTGVTADDVGAYSARVSNQYGFADSGSAQLTVQDWGQEFKITSLTSNNPVVIEHYDLTGYQLGPIAASSTRLFYCGGSATAEFNLEDLSGGSSLGQVFQTLVSDLRTERVYSFANGTNLTSTYYGTTITSLLEHDPNTGQLNGNRIDLTMPIPFTGYYYGEIGFFAGYGRIVVHTGTRVYMILMPSGLVVDMGAMNPPLMNYPSSWAYYGVAEYFDGALYLDTIADTRTIQRTRVPDGAASTIAQFVNLGWYMSSFTVSAYNGRWYFQHEYDSQFRSGGNETLGFADATFSFKDLPRPPEIVSQPISQNLSAGSTWILNASASGSRPLSYQWHFKGSDLPGETNASLRLENITLSQSGNYSVTVSNPEGTADSSNAVINVVQLKGVNFQITSLSTNNAYAIEHSQNTGDTRGPIAASSSQVFYTGDNNTAPFALGDLTPGASVSRLEALVSNLRSETVYSLANGTNLLPNGGGIITSLIQLDPNTGGMTTNRIDLSAPIPASTTVSSGGNIGIFAGYDRIMLHNGSRVYDISLPGGLVTEIGTMPPGKHINSEAWAYWGMAEFVNGAVWLVYARDTRTIVRTRVPDGFTTPVATFSNLASMASITASIYLNRWYFHHTGNSQFRSGDETLGFADATFAFDDSPRPPKIIGQLASQTALAGSTVRFRSAAEGSAPLSLQWFYNGLPIDGATSSDLVLNNVLVKYAGRYSVAASNEFGVAFSSEALLDVVAVTGEPFQILELSTNNVYVIEHGDITGDDRSAIAVSTDRVFYTGDSGSAGFGLLGLDNPLRVGQTNDALFSDLKTGKLYSLGNGANVLPNGGGTATTLLENDPYTGALTGRSIPLTMPISLTASTSGSLVGIFAGYGRVVLHNGNRVYDVALPSGVVTDLGAMPSPSHQTSGSWAYWGVAELADGALSLVCVQDYYTITRTRVPDGAVSTVATFSSLGYMSAISVSPSLGRWYFHHTSSSQFSSGGDETLGFGDARFSVTPAPTPPTIAIQPRDRTVLQGQAAAFEVWAVGSQPMSYQWQFNGSDIPNATSSILSLTNASLAQAGEYQVLISNPAGMVISLSAKLVVWSAFPLERNFRITALTSNNAAIYEDYPIVSSDRGPVAVSPSRVFYTGYNATAKYQASDLSGGTNTGLRYEAMACNLRTETVYALAHGNIPLPYGGGEVNALIALDPDTGALTANRIELSTPVTLSYGSGIFSGYDQIAFYNYNNEHVYLIDLPSGSVIDLGYMYFYANYRGWAYFGVVEQFDNAIHLVYVRDSQSIVRVRVPDQYGSTETVATFANLGSMCAFDLSLSRGRWYFHYAYGSQFGGTNGTLGFADAAWTYPPGVSRVPDLTLLEDTSSDPMPFVLSSLQSPVEQLVVSAHSSDTNVVPDGNIVLAGSGTNRTVAVTPLPGAFGNLVITLTATDSFGVTGSSSFNVNVLPVNDPPSFQLAGTALTILEDAGAQAIPGFVTNISVGPANESSGYYGGYYNYQYVSLYITNDNPALFSAQPYISYWSYFDTQGTLTFTAATNQFGVAHVTVWAVDSGGTNNGGIDTSAPQQFTITILPVNDPPYFELSALELVVPEDSGPQIVPNWATNISAGPSNEMGQALTFTVLNDNPTLFATLPVISPSGTLTFLPALYSNGVAHLTAILQDDGGTNNGGVDAFVAPLSFTIRVTPVNHPPVAYPQALAMTENATLAVTLTGSDVENSPLTYSVTAPLHGTLQGAAPNLVYRPVTNYAGTDHFTYQVSDGELLSQPATISITVTSLNQAPIAMAMAWSPSLLRSNETGVAILSLNNSNAVLVLDACASSDPDHDKLSYYWWENGATNIFATGMKITNRVALGSYAIVLGVDDGTDVSTNCTQAKIMSAEDAVEELVLAVNAASLERKEKKQFIDKLKDSIKDFGKAHFDSGLDHLREFREKLADEVADKYPAVFKVLDDAALDIIYAFEGVDLITARNLLGQLLNDINASTIARKDKKALLEEVKDAFEDFDKGDYDKAFDSVSDFQEEAEDRLGHSQPGLAVQWSATAQSILDILETVVKKQKK